MESPLETERLEGPGGGGNPVSSPPATRAKIDWGLARLGVLLGVCVGLAYVLIPA